MKKRCKILLVLVFQFLFAGFIHASEVWFINPSNGETMIHYTGYGTSATTIPVNLQYNQHFSTMYGGFVKLTDHNGVEHFSNQGNGIDQWWYLTPGTYTWKLDIYDFNLRGKYYWANSAEITFYVKHTLRVKNSFEGGNLKIDGETTTNGSSAYKFIGDNLGVGAIDQTYGGAQQVWNASGTNNSQWKIQRFGSGSINFLSYNRNYDYTVQNNDNAATIKGYYKVKPEVPQNLSVTANSNDHPLLSWTANTEPDLDKYNVYRKRSSPFIDWTLIGTASSNSYEDTGVNTSHHHGDDIYYKVTAVSTNNIESDYSNTVWIEARIEKKGIDNGNETDCS